MTRKQTLRKRPSNGNISIVGKKTFEKNMRRFGESLVLKLAKVLPESKIRPYIIDVKTGSHDKRLTFDVESRFLESCFETLKQNGFDCVYEPKTSSPYLRIWAIPIDFLESRIKDLKNDWKGDFNFTARINQQGALEIAVSDRKNSNETDSEVMTFYDLITSSFPDLDVRKKQKPRKGSAVPGFVIRCNLIENTLSSSETHPVTPETAEVINEYSSTLTVVDLLTFALSRVSDNQKIEILRNLLPKGIGMYNADQPLKATDEGFKINSI